MAFHAIINGMTNAGTSIEIDVTFSDDASGFTQRQNVHIQDGTTATAASMLAAVTAAATPLKATLAAYTVVKAHIGDNLII